MSVYEIEKIIDTLNKNKKNKTKSHVIRSLRRTVFRGNRFMRLNVLESNTNELVILIEKYFKAGKIHEIQIQMYKTQNMFNNIETYRNRYVEALRCMGSSEQYRSICKRIITVIA